MVKAGSGIPKRERRGPDLISDDTNTPKVQDVVKRLNVRNDGVHEISLMSLVFKFSSDSVRRVPVLVGQGNALSKMFDGIRHGVFTSMSQLVDMVMREIHGQMLVEEYWIKERDVLDAHKDPVVGVWFGL